MILWQRVKHSVMDLHCCLIAILSCHLLHTQNAVWYVFLSSLIASRKPKHSIFPFLAFFHDWKFFFKKSVIVISSFYHICIHLSQSVNTSISCQTQYWWEEVMMDLVTECIEPSVCQTCRAMMWVQNFSISPRLESQIPFSFTDRRWRFPCQQRYKYIQHLRPRNQHIAQQQGCDDLVFVCMSYSTAALFCQPIRLKLKHPKLGALKQVMGTLGIQIWFVKNNFKKCRKVNNIF